MKLVRWLPMVYMSFGVAAYLGGLRLGPQLSLGDIIGNYTAYLNLSQSSGGS